MLELVPTFYEVHLVGLNFEKMFAFAVGVIIGLETSYNIVENGLFVSTLCFTKCIDTLDILFVLLVRYDIRRCTLFRKVFCFDNGFKVENNSKTSFIMMIVPAQRLLKWAI